MRALALIVALLAADAFAQAGRAHAAGVSLAHDWALDLVEAQPVPGGSWSKSQSDARYCKLTGCTMTGELTTTALKVRNGSASVTFGTAGNQFWGFTTTGTTQSFMPMTLDNGADLVMGSGSDIQGSGTNSITSGSGGLNTTGSIDFGGGFLTSSATSLPLEISSFTDSATVTATAPAVLHSYGATLAAGDLVETWKRSSGPTDYLFSLTYYGPKNPTNNGTSTSGTIAYSGQMLHRVTTVTFAESGLDAAATSDETIFVLPAKTRLLRIIADVTQTFSGGGITDMDVICGTAAGSNVYLTTFDVDTATGTYGDVAAEIGSALLSATVADTAWTGGNVVCRFTCAGANCSAATQGSMNFYIEHIVFEAP